MKFARFLGFLWILFPGAVFAASSFEFQNASQLLSAARRGDIQTVQVLINNGANVNYVDSTGLSLVCTAVMNNDTRAIQVLQMYGADASQCDRQIKNYKQKSRVAVRGEEYGFFSGLSSSHILALSAVGVAAVIGGVALLTDAFDAKNDNFVSSSGGSHSSNGGGSSSSGLATKDFTIPYGPAFVNVTTGNVNPDTNVDADLANWDTQSTSDLRKDDFNYLRVGTDDNFIDDGLNSLLQNYLLVMGGYYSFVNGYMGQNIFRDSNNNNVPVLPAIENAQGRPVRVALITGNGINPAGSADSADGITYAVSTAMNSSTPTVDKYLNNTLSSGVETESAGYDASGSGSAFNPYADVNDSALAKIVAGWEAGVGTDARTKADLYGFVPNGQLAIYRTGNGTEWNEILPADSRTQVGTFTDADGDGVLSSGDTVVIGGVSYNIVTALSQTSIAGNPTLTINGTTYNLSTNSKIFVGKCGTSCEDIAIYVGTDGGWYVNSTGGNDIDSVYIADEDEVYEYKTKSTDAVYTNFSAMATAAERKYSVTGDPSLTTVDVIANTNVLPTSRDSSYLSVDYFTTMAGIAEATDLRLFYRDTVSGYYGAGEGGNAHSLFNGYSSTQPMIVMPAGDRLYKKYNPPVGEGTGTYDFYLEDLSATFENYAPMVYGSNLKHNFMTVVAVSHETGTSSADTISGYADGTSSAYGPIVLSKWVDTDTQNVYSSRKCGVAGVGGNGVDPWCFAASGPTAEMATASAAGAVAVVKSAFPYMSNDQVFTLLALTADGPFLATSSSGSLYSTDTLVAHLKTMYDLPTSYNEDSLSSSEYLDAFQDVFGYGLINLSRAIQPTYSVYYFADGNIVSDSGQNKFWGNVSTSTGRASTALSGRGTVRTAFFDVIESLDGSMSLPRVWNTEISLDNDYKRGLYMGDVLAEFAVDSTNKQNRQIGNMTFDMAMSPRAYVDNLNGLDNLKVAFSNENYDLDANYQRYLTDGESRFSGRANGVLSLVANSVSSGAKYKSGNFAFGAHAFSGTITDENLLQNDPALTSQFEPARLGLANGGAIDLAYNKEKFNLNISFGNMNETKTVLGSLNEGLLSLNGANTQYIDAVAKYSPFDKVNLSARATFANTHANVGDGIVSTISDIKSNAFAIGADAYGFDFTVAMPLAVVDGRMGYDYADLYVVENNGQYEVAINNPHTEYIDLAAQKRELRFSGSYKKSIGEFTDAGVGFIYRVNPGNTDVFGNESILMFKLHHRLGI